MTGEVSWIKPDGEDCIQLAMPDRFALGSTPQILVALDSLRLTGRSGARVAPTTTGAWI